MVLIALGEVSTENVATKATQKMRGRKNSPSQVERVWGSCDDV